MPQRKLRVPIATGTPNRSFRLSEDAWTRIEKAYRRAIPPDARNQIQEATRVYLRLAEEEERAAPLELAFEEIAATRKAATLLIERLRAIKDCTSDVHSFVGHRISQRLKRSTGWPLGDHLADLVRGLEVLSSALAEVDANGARKSAIAETENAKVERNGAAVPMPREVAKKYRDDAFKAKAAPVQAAGTQQEGDAWRRWVRKLAVVLKESNLPAGASKTPDYPLFRLVKAIQNELPADRKISGRFLSSLPDAIYKAVRSPPS
jgi:hypothetical protein